MSDLLENLNEEQKSAVTHRSGPLMIVAGAGTGKTTVITRRIAWLIEEGLAKPHEILALTFTEKAASEMEERVDKLLPIGMIDVFIATFHGFCDRLLREYALDIGLSPNYRLLTEMDSLHLLRKYEERFAFELYKPRSRPSAFYKSFLNYISKIKDFARKPDELIASLHDETIPDDEAERELFEKERELLEAFQTFEQILLEEAAMDFGNLISMMIELLKTRPSVRQELQNRFKYILVDEFQDTNPAQYELVKLLIGDEQNITVVGDDDQSIYAFRGASLQNILTFRSDFPSAKQVVLTTNYRSKQEVLDHSYTLISKNNPHRLEAREDLSKELKAHHEMGGQVSHHHFASEEDEVDFTLRTIVEQKQNGSNWGDMAILVRANAHAKAFIDGCERTGIPYKFHALEGLYTEPTILDTLAWLHVIHQPHESTYLYRVLRMQSEIEADAIARLSLEAKKSARSLYDVLLDSTPEEIQDLVKTIQDLQTMAGERSASEVFVETVKRTGILGRIRLLPEIDQQREFDLLNQLYKRMTRFEKVTDDKSLRSFLDELRYERDSGEEGPLQGDVELGPDAVQIMTVHGSKGLEFDYIFLPSLVEQRFPGTKRRDPLPLPKVITDEIQQHDDYHVHEERRLFYVALTRARVGAYLLSADFYGGKRKRKPSRFLAEMDITPMIEPPRIDAIEEAPKVDAPPAKLKSEAPHTFSFTQIAAYGSCPLQYKFAHILKIPVFGNPHLSFGKSLHNTLHQYLERYRQSGQLGSKEELHAIFEDEWMDEWYENAAARKEAKEKGQGIIDDYHSIIQKTPPNILHLELPFKLSIGGIQMKGRIDRIDKLEDGVEIIDYKTGKPKTRLDWDAKRQLILYKIACEEALSPPMKVNRLTYHYLDDHSTVSIEPKEKDIERLKQEIMDSAKAITDGDFNPMPGFHCQFCDFRDICEFRQV